MAFDLSPELARRIQYLPLGKQIQEWNLGERTAAVARDIAAKAEDEVLCSSSEFNDPDVAQMPELMNQSESAAELLD